MEDAPLAPTPGQLDDAAGMVVACAGRAGSATPADIIGACAQAGFEGAGDCAVYLGDTNVVIFGGLSEYAADVVGLLVRPGSGVRLEALNPASAVLVLAWDGSPLLNLPFAKRPPKGGYTKPHWAPCVLVADPSDGR